MKRTLSALASPGAIMTRRILQLAVGLFLYGIGIALMVRGAVGLSPWDVLSQGISLQTGIPFGWVTVLISMVVLCLWIPIRQKPGIGTIANAILVGIFADMGLIAIPEQEDLLVRIVLFSVGLLTIGVATGMYIGARFGPGPRDGLMTGLHRVTGWPIWLVRTLIEVIVLIIGWMLGGNVGIGTLAFALLIGPIVGFFMPILLVPAARTAETAEPSSSSVE